MKEKVVVLGGSSGMGFSIAKACLAKGYEVVIASRSKEKLDKAKKALKKVKAFSVDLRSEKEIAKFFSSLSRFDHLIVSAADFVSGPFLELKVVDAKGFFDSKFWGQFIAAKYGALKIRKGGSILFFSGSAGQKPIFNLSAAAAINGAIEALTRALALELSPIRVNAISPGIIRTPIWDTMEPKARKAAFQKAAERLLTKRVGEPEDIAKAALYLIECGYATGTVVSVDGGEKIL